MDRFSATAENLRGTLGKDFFASIVVFLVALPLCMGIAIASGVPPALGLITGIVGGLVVGAISGSPLQVSGPAAGLTVLVYDIVEKHGVAMLGVIVLLAGPMQGAAGLFKKGPRVRAVSPAVIPGTRARVVGAISGSPLQVSGPAAGLTVLVYDIVEKHGVAMLGVIVLLAGLMQVAAGLFKTGQWFRAISPAVIQGMLAGIGVLIIASQIHVVVDDAPRGSGLQNLLSIPEALWKGIMPLDGSSHHLAAG